MKKITLLLLLMSTVSWAQITVSVDVSEIGAGGVNIVTPATPGGSDWSEAAATDEGNGVFSYTFSSVAAGVKVEYIWKIYYTAGGNEVESLLGKIRGGDVENDLGANLPAQEVLNTDFSSYCNRAVLSSGAPYTAQRYFFNSIRQPGVDYPEITVTAPAGNNLVIDYSSNSWSTFHGPGARDNGNGTHTIIVDPTTAFEYKWVNLTTTTSEDLLTCANDGVLINTDNSTYANRIHAAGQDRSDDFGVCPTTASIDENDLISLVTFPNPSNTNWNIKTANSVITSVEVFNLLGKRVLSQKNNSTDVAISTEGLTNGIYLARVTTDLGTKSIKLIKN
jgi:hypothetical protein